MKCVLRVDSKQQERAEESKAAPSRDAKAPDGIVGTQTERPCLTRHDDRAEPGIIKRLDKKIRELGEEAGDRIKIITMRD